MYHQQNIYVHLEQVGSQKSETRMTVSILKQNPNILNVQKNAYLLGHKYTILCVCVLINKHSFEHFMW